MNTKSRDTVDLIADALEAAAHVLRSGVEESAGFERPPPAMEGTTRLLVSVAEAAEWLSVSRTTAYDLISAGMIPSVKVGRRRLVPTEALRTRVTEWSLQATNA